MLCSFTTKTSGSAEPGTASRIHISADGTVTFNGRPVSIDRLAGYVAAERAKLPESDRADMQVLLTSDVSGSPAALVGKTVTFGAAGQLEVLRSDRAYPSDVRTMIFAGNVQARFRDETPDPSLKDVLTEIRCDSLVVNPAGRNFECFDAGFSNASMLSFGKWYRFLADDSGLMVDSLDGAPGVYSARYGHKNSDAERIDYLLANLKDVPAGSRAAKFVCVITCLWPDGRKIVARGECPGEILFAPQGTGGFGYDPVFFLPELGKTYAELTPAEKNAISHRARALQAFCRIYQEELEHDDK